MVGSSYKEKEDYCSPRNVPLIEQLYFTRTIYTFLMPAVCILGSIGAGVCILIFTRKSMRTSLNIYLAGLSCFDLALLLMSLLIYPSMSLCLQEGNSGATCHVFWRTSLATYPASLMAQTASVWTCVAITVDRFLAVRYPLQTRVWCTTTRARFVLICIGILSALYKLPSIFELSLDECGRLTPTELRNHPLYIIIYNTYGYLLLLLVLPFLIMIVLNFFVVKEVRRATGPHRQLQPLPLPHSRESRNPPTRNGSERSTGGEAHPLIVIRGGWGPKEKSESLSQPAENVMQLHISSTCDNDGKCTKMAIITIMAFLGMNWLAGMNQVIEAFDLDVPGNAYRIPIGNLLVCLNSATNILIYSTVSKRFRQETASTFIALFYPSGGDKYEATI